MSCVSLTQTQLGNSMRAAVLFFATLSVLACVDAASLPSVGADIKQTTTSGISAGAFFSFQFHVAFSSDVMGAAGIAGGPFYCAGGTESGAFVKCMYATETIDVSSLVAQTKSYASSGDIDDPSNMADDKVWVYSGTADSVVSPKVVKTVPTYYENFVNSSNIAEEFSIPSQHAWITDGEGNACSFLGSPYINDCHYDAAGKILSFFYGDLKPKVDAVSSNLIQFDQTEFIPSTFLKTVSLNSYGYVYIPSGCQSTNSQCRVHIAFHGCQMNPDSIQDKYEKMSGFNGWAEANNIVILYPQTKASALGGNPEACFDWWGYSGSNYATKKGVQMAAVYNMLQRLTAGA